MTDWLLALVPIYGLWLLAACTFLSCLALPIPASVMMVTAGGFVAAGDLVLWQVAAAALAGAVLGDQLGYWTGRAGGAALLARNGQKAGLLGRAAALMAAQGSIAVFLSRWLFSPLGPWVNLTAGTIGFGWHRFVIWGLAGEAIWVGLYVGLGFGFAGNLQAANDMLGSLLGLLAAGAVMVGLGLWLRALLRQEDGAA